MNENNLPAKEVPVVEQKPIFSYAIKIDATSSLAFFVCPFCFSVYNFHPDYLKSSKSKCNCGATFSQLGYATKYIISEV